MPQGVRGDALNSGGGAGLAERFPDVAAPKDHVPVAVRFNWSSAIRTTELSGTVRVRPFLA
jgi:hypothetical protein